MKKLGEGQYGRVYRSQHKGVPLAIKINTTQLQVSFLSAIREVDLLGHMQFSSHFIRLLGLRSHKHTFNVDDGYRIDNLGLKFELADGDLQDYLDNQSKYNNTIERTDRYIISLLTGLAELHQSGFVHRDIKPANVLILNDEVKYCDFGLSKREMIKMTPRMMISEYRAPEIYNEQIYDAKADVWALGCMFVEMISRKEPHSAPGKRDVKKWLNWIKDSKWLPMIEKMLVEDPSIRKSAIDLLQEHCGKNIILPELPPIAPLTTLEEQQLEPYLKLFTQTIDKYQLDPIRRNTIHLFRQYLNYAQLHGVNNKYKLEKGATLVWWQPNSKSKRALYDHEWRWYLCHYLAIKYFHEERHICSFDSFTKRHYTHHLELIEEFERILVEDVYKYRLWIQIDLLPY